MTDEGNHICGMACQRYGGKKIPAEHIERIFLCLEYRGVATIIWENNTARLTLTEHGYDLAQRNEIWS